MLTADGGDAEATLARFAQAGIDVPALATQLQKEGADAFVASWDELLTCIGAKSDQLALGTAYRHRTRLAELVQLPVR